MKIPEWPHNGKYLRDVSISEVGSVIQFLKDSDIFEISPCSDGFVITEGCDRYFSVELSVDELRALGRELISLADEGLRRLVR